jgi:hypothetical protein
MISLWTGRGLKIIALTLLFPKNITYISHTSRLYKWSEMIKLKIQFCDDECLF